MDKIAKLGRLTHLFRSRELAPTSGLALELSPSHRRRTGDWEPQLLFSEADLRKEATTFSFSLWLLFLLQSFLYLVLILKNPSWIRRTRLRGGGVLCESTQMVFCGYGSHLNSPKDLWLKTLQLPSLVIDWCIWTVIRERCRCKIMVCSIPWTVGCNWLHGWTIWWAWPKLWD